MDPSFIISFFWTNVYRVKEESVKSKTVGPV